MNMQTRKQSPVRLVALLAASASIVLFASYGCAEREDPTDVEIEAHPESWVDPASPDFHGTYVEALFEAGVGSGDPSAPAVTGVDGCRTCHGDLGEANGDQCRTCHVLGSPQTGGHPDAGVWLSPGDDGFHGRVVALAGGSDQCRVCHGVDYLGGWVDVRCTLCHDYRLDEATGLYDPHPEAAVWFDQNSDEFHGKQVELLGPQLCKLCHGSKESDMGGWAGVSCYNACHAGGAGGHPDLILWINQLHGQQDPADCMRCHGPDLTTGGTSGVPCNRCHSWPYPGP